MMTMTINLSYEYMSTSIYLSNYVKDSVLRLVEVDTTFVPFHR